MIRTATPSHWFPRPGSPCRDGGGAHAWPGWEPLPEENGWLLKAPPDSVLVPVRKGGKEFREREGGAGS